MLVPGFRPPSGPAGRWAFVLLVMIGLSLTTTLAGSTYYVSSSSTAASPCTISVPCQPAKVWSRVHPGDTVIFKNGVYTGAAYMLNPPASLDGTSSNPITVRAETDGGVRINGEFQHLTVEMNANDWYVVEGFNVHASSGTIFWNYGGKHCVFRRCIGWDAVETDKHTFVTGDHALIEDCAGFGVIHQHVASFADDVTVRRSWFRWEGSTETAGPHNMSPSRDSFGRTYENNILTWDNGSMPSGPRYIKNRDTIVSGPYTGWQSGNPRGMYGMAEWEAGGECQDFAMLGSLHYIKGQENFPYNDYPDGRWMIGWKSQAPTWACCWTLKNFATWVDPTNARWAGVKGLILDPPCTARTQPLDVRDYSSISKAPNDIGAGWNQTNIEVAASTSALGDAGQGGIYARDEICEGPHDPFDCCTGDGTGSCSGAGICYRYVDRVETRTPLFPWPMQERIRAATTFASASNHKHLFASCNPANTPNCIQVEVNDPHAVADVMADLEAMFGPPPPACTEAGTGGESQPSPPEEVWRTDTDNNQQ